MDLKLPLQWGRNHYGNAQWSASIFFGRLLCPPAKALNCYKIAPVFIFSWQGTRAIVVARYWECALNPFSLSLTPLVVLSLGALAQDIAVLPSAYALTATSGRSVDRGLAIEADGARKKLEASLGEYLVAFDSRYDGGRKKVGLSLTSFSGSPLELAYDPGAKNMMAQVRFGQTITSGVKLNYQAFVSEAGTVNFLISSRF
jgi:hypothetical protein